MRIVVIGTRGIPDILGGVESHCQALYPRIVIKGFEVILIRRKPYTESSKTLKAYKGIALKDLWAPRNKSFEAIIHTFLAVIQAKALKADILHIHAIGPSLMVPLARILGMKVVMTHHGPDYDRQKWGVVAKRVLRWSEFFGVHYADRVIAISELIRTIVQTRNPKAEVSLIFNGVELLTVPPDHTGLLNKYNLKPSGYMVAVGRFVPEKGFHDLIDAYIRSELDVPLVIVGDADHESVYSLELKNKARTSGVILTGFRSGDELKVLFGNACLFVLPSYHEGLPISLLEAMSYGLNVLVSDIQANKIEGLGGEDFFKVGDIAGLSEKMKEKLKNKSGRDYQSTIRKFYNWDVIAEQTIEVYKGIAGQK